MRIAPVPRDRARVRDRRPQCAQRGRRDVPPAVATVLASIKRADTEQYAVSEEDGRLLRVLASTRGARRALEIGGASGYSAIWIGLALQRDRRRARHHRVRRRARPGSAERTSSAPASTAVVRVVAGDAFAEIPKIAGTFDFVFLDAWKRDYLKFLDLTFPRLVPGGLFVAHNVVNKRDEMQDFLSAVLTRPDMLTTIVSPSGEGCPLLQEGGQGPWASSMSPSAPNRPHSRRAARSGRRPPGCRHGAVGGAHRRPRRAAGRDGLRRSSTRAISARRFPKRAPNAIRRRNTSARSRACASGCTSSSYQSHRGGRAADRARRRPLARRPDRRARRRTSPPRKAATSACSGSTRTAT